MLATFLPWQAALFFTNLVSFKVVTIFGEFSAVAKIQLI